MTVEPKVEQVRSPGGVDYFFDAEIEDGRVETSAPFVEFSNQILARCGRRDLKTVVDVGAHVGTFSILAAKEYGAELVIACEPDPLNRARLTNNVAMNGVSDKVVILPFAISDRSLQRVKLQRVAASPVNNSGQSSIAFDFGKTAQVFDVWTLDFEELASLVVLERHKIDLLKIDVEGAEWSFLQGSWLKSASFIDVELHNVWPGTPKFKTASEELVAVFAALGFVGEVTDASEGGCRYYGRMKT